MENNLDIEEIAGEEVKIRYYDKYNYTARSFEGYLYNEAIKHYDKKLEEYRNNRLLQGYSKERVIDITKICLYVTSLQTGNIIYYYDNNSWVIY